MKTTLPLLTTACAGLLVGTMDVRAQYSSDVRPPPPPPQTQYVYVPYVPGPLYAGVDVGGTLMQNMPVKNNGTRLSFDPGTRFDVKFGYYIAPPLSVEFETGVIWNALVRDNNQPLTAGGQDSGLYQVPLLVNLVLHAPLPGGCSAYIGAGAGGVVSDLYVTSGNNHHRDFSSDSDVTFAYQGMAGIRCPIARRLEVGVGYKFLGTLDHSWFDGDSTLFTHSGPSYSHSILASFTATF